MDIVANDGNMDMLPDDSILTIFQFLDLRSLLACRCLSQRFRRLSETPSLWKRLCEELYGIEPSATGDHYQDSVHRSVKKMGYERFSLLRWFYSQLWKQNPLVRRRFGTAIESVVRVIQDNRGRDEIISRIDQEMVLGEIFHFRVTCDLDGQFHNRKLIALTLRAYILCWDLQSGTLEAVVKMPFRTPIRLGAFYGLIAVALIPDGSVVVFDINGMRERVEISYPETQTDSIFRLFDQDERTVTMVHWHDECTDATLQENDDVFPSLDVSEKPNDSFQKNFSSGTLYVVYSRCFIAVYQGSWECGEAPTRVHLFPVYTAAEAEGFGDDDDNFHIMYIGITGDYLAVYLACGKIRVFDRWKARLLFDLPGHADPRDSTANGRLVALAHGLIISGGPDKRICLWSLPQQKILAEGEATGGVLGMARYNRYVSVMTQETTVELWEIICPGDPLPDRTLATNYSLKRFRSPLVASKQTENNTSGSMWFEGPLVLFTGDQPPVGGSEELRSLARGERCIFKVDLRDAIPQYRPAWMNEEWLIRNLHTVI
eukprot:Rmarinus@m.21247